MGPYLNAPELALMEAFRIAALSDGEVRMDPDIATMLTNLFRVLARMQKQGGAA